MYTNFLNADELKRIINKAQSISGVIIIFALPMF
jgi:hypothetical protein